MTATELALLPSEELTWQTMAAYEVASGDVGTWALMLGLEPDEESTTKMFDLTHVAYAQLWLAMGDAFHEQLWPRVRRWEEARRRQRSARN